MLVKDNQGYTWYDKKITKSQYDKILIMLRNIPTPPDGYAHRLTESLEWELYKLPIEITEGDETQ